MTVWSILAPGPSLALWSHETFQAKGPVVAVNNAVLSPLPSDIWCCQDPPAKFNAVWALMPPEARRRTLVWCRESLREAWEELGMRVWSHPVSETEFQAEFVANPVKVHYTSLTITTAMARVIGMGAERVELYGCDMTGDHYAYGNDNRNRAPKVWQARWQDEPRTFDLVVQQWEALGIKVVRMNPPVPVNARKR